MKTKVVTAFIALASLAGSVTYGAVPSISVMVADSSGRTAYKGALDSKGSFGTGVLKPGGYVVQFNSKSVPKDGKYALVISAGKKKMVANAVEGAKFNGGGVAMRIDVGAGLAITGQVAADTGAGNAPMGNNGKPMVWIPKQLGSNMAAHWAESDSAEAKQAMTAGSYSTKNIQDKQNQGSSPGR
jgi:hypothetical protein